MKLPFKLTDEPKISSSKISLIVCLTVIILFLNIVFFKLIK